MSTFKGTFRVITNSGRLIGYYQHREEAEQVALSGYSRIRQQWFEGKYRLSRQYNRA